MAWTTRDGPTGARGLTQRGKRNLLRLVGAGLVAVGTILLIAAFATLMADRRANPKAGQAPSSALAAEIEEAGLGCEDFTIRARQGTGVSGEGTCGSEAGSLRIVMYRTANARDYAERLTRAYVCQALAARNVTEIKTVHGDTLNGTPRPWAIEFTAFDSSGAERLADALGAQVVSFDCATLFPAPPPPAPEPPPA
jgi:hypothetical protein